MTATIETMHIVIFRFLLPVFAMTMPPCFYMINKSGTFCAASISSLAKDPSISSQWLLTLSQWYKSLEYSMFRFAVALTTLYPYLGKSWLAETNEFLIAYEISQIGLKSSKRLLRQIQ